MADRRVSPSAQSDTHYRKDERQVQREELGTFVINRQQTADITATYAFTKQFSASVGVPFTSASWSIPTPTSPVPGPRAQPDARGIGDISATGRYWLGRTERCVNGNVAVGVGVKIPTGEYPPGPIGSSTRFPISICCAPAVLECSPGRLP